MVTAPRSTAVATLTALAALLAVTTCRDDRGTEPRPPTMAPGAPSFATSSASGPVTLVGAGNIAGDGGHMMQPMYVHCDFPLPLRPAHGQ